MVKLRGVLLVSAAEIVLSTIAAAPARASCALVGSTTTCTGVTAGITVGTGPGDDGRTVIVNPGALPGVRLDAGNRNAISLGDGATVQVRSGASVTATVPVGGNTGLYATGGNTIEFRNGGTLTIEAGAEVLSLGTQNQAEAVNLQGVGNVVTNDGTIRAVNAAAIWFETVSGMNTIINNATGIIQAPGNVVGTNGNAAVDFTNRGTVIGNLVLAGGDDTLRLYTGSVITGNFAAGGGFDSMFLSGDGAAALPGNMTEFEVLTKNGLGTWTLTGTITGLTVVTVQQGRLVLTGNNDDFTGEIVVDPAGILEARAQSLPPRVTDNGLVRFIQSDDGLYTGPIGGTGQVEKTGAGTLVLAPAGPGGNSYSGGTIITQGVLAIAADNAIGAPAGPLTFNGGTLRFDAGFDLAPSRPIAIAAPGGTIDTNGVATAIAQGITGPGGLTVTGAGSLTLTGANTYAGGTVISGGTLRLGAGGTSGSIAGNVINNGTLAFDRADTVTFAGAISGTGAVRQDGPGATVLTAANTYTGATQVNAGILRAGGTGVFSPASAVDVAAGAALDLAGYSQTVAGLANAGLVSLRGAPGTTLTVAGDYAGQGGVVALNTVLAGDGSASDRLVIQGGAATGVTGLRIANIGGGGAPTAEGIRVVAATAGGTTDPGAFRLDSRAAAGAFEYLLFRGGSSSADDWFLRSTLIDPPISPEAPLDPPPGSATPPAPRQAIPLYRPEVALYSPVPAVARQMGLATLATLHDRVGEEENLRDLTGSSPYANGAWARAFGERSRSRWDGTVDAATTANLIGLQAGFDILRTEPYADGHRDHAGVYVAYTDDNAPSVSGFALGRQNLRVGRLQMSGPAVGAYWTHFGPAGWYVDAVVQANWFDVTARSAFGAGMSTSGTGYAASLEAGYPIRFGQGWQIEPQAQIVWQSVSVDRSRDIFSTVAWDEGDAVTGRLGARVQYTGRSAEALWQPYVKANLWHGFSGTDRTVLGASAPIESRYGDTALEVGAGITARVSRTLSVYAHADYRWSLDGGRGRQTATQGSIGIRLNW